MTAGRGASPAFRQGEAVVLKTGTYQGTPGVFLRVKEDPRWAEIIERDGRTKSHPLEWLAHVT
jgi:hypothetical protein